VSSTDFCAALRAHYLPLRFPAPRRSPPNQFPSVKNCLLASFVATLLLGSTAQAQILTCTTATSPVLTASPAGNSQTLQLQGFNSSLGTLTQVKLTITGTVSQKIAGENTGTGSAPYNYNLGSTVSLDKAGGPNLFTSSLVSLTGSGSVQTFDGTIDFKGASAFHSYPNENFPTTADTLLNSVYLAPAGDLSSYISSGQLSFTAKAVGNSPYSFSGNSYVQTTNLASLGLKAEYSYTQIPEPSTYAMLTGLAALGFVTIRRRKA
jgi:hypothetical protein